MGVKFTVKYKHDVIKKLDNAAKLALGATAEALKTEVEQAQVVPKDIGTLEGDMRVVRDDISRGKATIEQNRVYARRLYFHPEYDFSKTENPNAKGKWFEDWLPGGSKADFCTKAYAKLYKKYSGV